MKNLVPLNIPPGAYRAGTEYQGKGRWRDVNMVRWDSLGVMRPMGRLFAQVGTVGRELCAGEIVRGALAWVDSSGSEFVAFGSANGLWVYERDTSTIFQLDTVSGNVDQGSLFDATQWQLFSFGEELLCWSNINAVIEVWDLNTAGGASTLTNAPTGVRGGFCVTDERFVLALSPGNETRRVEWSDRGDATVWTPLATNQAGGYTLEGAGKLRQGVGVRGATLIISDSDVWSATYVGYPDVYDFRRVGACSIQSHMAAVSTGEKAYWMGASEFYVADAGFVQSIPCDIGDWFFNEDLKVAQATKVQASHNHQADEVWWLYESANGTDVDSYIVYNYKLGVWYNGRLPISTVVDASLTGIMSGSTGDSYAFQTPDTITVTNGGFDTDSDWTKGTAWQIAGGVANQTTPTSSSISQTLSGCTPGRSYVIEYTISNHTTGNIQVLFDNKSTAKVGANETQVVALDNNSSTPVLSFLAANGFDGDIDNVSVYAPVLMVMEQVRGQSDTAAYTHLGSDPYAKTGPMEIGSGQARVHVTGLYPDEQDSGELDFTFTTREYPTGTETTHGPYSATNPTSVRFSGRQFTMKVEPSTVYNDFRVGTHRLEIKPGGKR